MQKSILLLSSLLTVVVTSLVLSSCKDDEPFVKPKLSLDESTMTVNEAAGTIEVDFVLDKSYSADITIEYDLGGTAAEGSAATSDYQILSNLGEVEISAGQTVGTIEIAINPDVSFEGNETIEISIDDVDSDDIDITNDDKVVITITDDDVKAKVSFASATLVASESDRNIQIQVVLDKAVQSNVVVQFGLSGDAVDSVRSETEEIASDYQVKGEPGETGEFTILSGQTSATLTIKSYSDFFLEDDETFIITLESAGTQVDIGTINDIEVTLEQENGRAVVLLWDDTYTTVDMDLFLWIGDVGDAIADLGVLYYSAFAGFDPPEIAFIPAVITDATFGFSYNYYAGDEDPMEFEVRFIDFVDGAVEPNTSWDIFNPSYGLANVNPWDESEVEPIIVQTMDVVDGVYATPSAITIPAEDSRIATPALPAATVKQGARGMTSGRMNSLIKKLK